MIRSSGSFLQKDQVCVVEASAGKIGTTMDYILLICLHYDAATGKYAWMAIGLLRIAGLITVLGLWLCFDSVRPEGPSH